MNQKKAKELRRKAFNIYITARDEKKKRISVRKIYQFLKKQYKEKLNVIQRNKTIV